MALSSIPRVGFAAIETVAIQRVLVVAIVGKATAQRYGLAGLSDVDL